MRQNKYIIGITGSIATGKSVATNFLREKGYQVIDADEISRLVVEEERIISRIKESFGRDIYEGKVLNRNRLGEIIFKSPKLRDELSKIVHPRVYEIIKDEIQKSNKKVLFLDIPLLIENREVNGNYHLNFDEIWLIYTPKELQLERLILRDQITEEYALSKINAQMDIEDKKNYVTNVLDNSGSVEDLKIQVERELKRVEERL